MQAFYHFLPILLFLLCACNAEKKPAEPVPQDTYFPISIGETTPELQLALTNNERGKGLMYRDELAENHGMLFLFDQPGQRSFWMRNTKIPLDLAYFDAQGTLLEIHPLYPLNENSVPSYSNEVLIAVEMNQGWFASKGIQPGAKLDLQALQQAVTRRGLKGLKLSIER